MLSIKKQTLAFLFVFCTIGHTVGQTPSIMTVPGKRDICWNHPRLSQVLTRNGYAYPAGHVLLDAWYRQNSAIYRNADGGNHENIDNIMRRREGYDPADHPNMDNFVTFRPKTAICYDFSTVRYPAAGTCVKPVPSWHPPIDSYINDATKPYPTSHASVKAMLGTWIVPSTHR